MKKWEQLPPKFQNDSVKHYYDILKKRTASLIIKRIFDIILGLILTVIALPFMLIIAVWIKCDSKGKVFFLQRRVTKAGKFLRKCRLDELPQLFNVLKGDMSFVGTRPEVERYVDRYSDEMLATLLMPAGITSLASIQFKDEEKLLDGAENPDDVYVNDVLPQKMKYNLEYINKFNFFYDIKLMFMTFFAVLK